MSDSFNSLGFLLPCEIIGIIIELCDQPSRIALGNCNKNFRKLVWFSGFWKDKLSIYKTDDLSCHLLRQRKVFAKIKTLCFGPRCKGLGPLMLSFISQMAPNLTHIDMSQVSDKLFLFGFHVIPTIRINPFWNDAYYNDVKKLFQRLLTLKINLCNYSLGLYMLLDRYKYLCPNLKIAVVIDETRIHHSTPISQYSIMQYIHV